MKRKEPVINRISDALSHFLHNFLQGASVLRSIDGDRGPFCYILQKNNKRYYMTFNRAWFFSFARIYNIPQGGIGQSFKMYMLQQAAHDNATLVTVMEDGHIYKVSAKAAYDYVNAHNTRRIPSTEIHEEGSIPAFMMRRVNVEADLVTS